MFKFNASLVLIFTLAVLVLTYLLQYDSFQAFYQWKPLLGLGVAVATNILNSLNKGTVEEQKTNLTKAIASEKPKE